MVEHSPLKFYNLQHFGKHVHLSSRGTPGKLPDSEAKSWYDKHAAIKKDRRADKYWWR